MGYTVEGWAWDEVGLEWVGGGGLGQSLVG